MNVALSLPDLGPGPGSRSLVTRGNLRGFRRAGHEVTVYYAADLPKLAARSGEYDLIVLRTVGTTIETDSAHLHHELGSYGPPDLDPELVENTFQKADTVSMPDPAIADKAPWFQALDRDPGEVAMIPSPPDPDLFPAQPRETSEGSVLVPELGTEYAPDERLAVVASETTSISYRALARETSRALPTNVHRYPPVPVSSMPEQYAAAELVFSPAQAAALPRVCYEAFCSGRAYVSAPEAIGALQTLPAEVVEESAFGSSVEWWRDTYRASFFEGDHCVTADPDSQSAVLVDLLDDRDRRWEVAAGGREWVESVFGNWGWQEKAEALVGLLDR